MPIIFKEFGQALKNVRIAKIMLEIMLFNSLDVLGQSVSIGVPLYERRRTFLRFASWTNMF